MENTQEPSDVGSRFGRFRENLNLSLHAPEPITPYSAYFYEKLFRRGKPIAPEIAENLRRVEAYRVRGKYNEETAKVVASEYRALGYLYGDRETTSADGLPENPLIDILTLVSGPGYKPGIHFQLAVTGPPEQIERYRNVDPSAKQDQYSYSENKLGERKVFRTLSRFGDTQGTMARGLHIFARITDRYPELLKPTLEEYVETVTKGEGNTTGMAVGMLELLFNMDLIQDPRFSHLSSSLRNMVLEDVGDIENLKQQYFYRVTEYNPFWLEGERETKHTRAVLYGAEKTEVEPEEALPLAFPESDQWDYAVRKRAEAVATITELTPATSITRSAQKSERTLDTFTSDLRKTIRQKSELVEAIRLQSQRLPFELRRTWETWLENFSKDRKTTPSDAMLIEGAVKLIMGNFVTDRNLSRKSANHATSTENQVYKIDQETLLRDPLFNWVFALRDDKLAASFEKGAAAHPEEFSLLLRLMTYNTAARFLRKKEAKFLFDPHYKEKVDPETMVKIVRNLRDLVNRHRPDIKNIFLETLGEGDKQIGDLMEKKRVAKVKKNLNTLTYEEPVPLVQVDKSKKMTRRAFLKTMGYTAVALGIAGAYGGVIKYTFYQGGKENSDFAKVDALIKNSLRSNDNARNRTPDAIKPEELKLLQPFFYGFILNLPRKYFSGADGEDIGYFPVRWLEFGQYDYFDSDKQKTPFSNVLVVDSLAKANLKFQSDQLVIYPKELTMTMLPPVGWKIVHVVQENGAKPMVGRLGQIYYSLKDSPPERAILVLEKIPDRESQQLSPAVSYMTGVNLAEANFMFRPDRAAILNEHLAGDPKLQGLHKQFIDEVSAQVQTNPDDKQSLTDIAVKYSLLYDRYTRENRYYALGFSVKNNFSDNDYPSLEAIANNPDKGYYCQVASQAYREFMTSGGFMAVDQPGFTFKDYKEQLWGQVGHQNNAVILPNGNVLYVDMTPEVTERTPKEDIDALTPKQPKPEEVQTQQDQESIFNAAIKYGVGIGVVGTALYGSYELYGRIRHQAALGYVEKFLSETRGLSEIEKEVLLSTVNDLAYKPYTAEFYGEAARVLDNLNLFSAEKHGSTVQWLLNNHVGLLHGATPQEAYDKLVAQHQQEPDILRAYIGETQSERPPDFDVAFETAKLLDKNRVDVLRRRLYQNLGVETGDKQASEQASYKAADILEMVSERLYDDAFRRQHMVRKESAPYYQALYDTLQSLGTA